MPRPSASSSFVALAWTAFAACRPEVLPVEPPPEPPVASAPEEVGRPPRPAAGVEWCDGVDDDGDGVVPEAERDADGDGFVACELGPLGWRGATGVLGGSDCDDADPGRWPGAPEQCNGRSDACAEAPPADESDLDGDGFRGCGGDCDDEDPHRHPGAEEECNGRDDDCDGALAASEVDGDGDGYVSGEVGPGWLGAPGIAGGDCDDADQTRRPGAVELCDGLDGDCDGQLDLTERDKDGDGYVSCRFSSASWRGAAVPAGGDDCDDFARDVNLAAPEVCDLLDNDCNGRSDDEDPTLDRASRRAFFRDDDHDGYGTTADVALACLPPKGYSEASGDCDDRGDRAHPLAREACDGLDNDCNGVIDDTRAPLRCVRAAGREARALDPIPASPNVLLVVLDDWGTDMWSGGGAPEAPPTPTIDRLAGEGVSFQRAWSAPNCSPSRAALLTGLPPHATGIGDVLGCPNGFGLSRSFETVAERLSDAGYATAMYGKWHLGRIAGSLDADEASDPLRQGFDEYAGAVLSGADCSTDGLPNRHYDWERCENGDCARTTTYDTESQFEDATAAVTSLPEPWFVYLPVYAPHAEYVDPPDPIEAGGTTTAQRRYRSMVADVDARLGDLLAHVDGTDTIVVVLGDNGTPPDAVMDPWDATRSKGTAFDGGVHVPLLVRGPGIAAGGVARQLVHLTDLFATFAEVAGVPLPADHPAATTSHSFVPALRDPERAEGRPFVFTEGFEGSNGDFRPEVTQQAVMDEDGWKLVRIDTCDGGLDPVNFRNWVCDQPRSWSTPVLQLYHLADQGPPADRIGDDLLADGTSEEEAAIVSRLRGVLDEDWAPQDLPTW